MTFTFRQAAPSERDDVERVLRAAFAPYARALGRELSTAGFARLRAELEGGDIFVALDGDRIVGVVRTERRKDELYIDQIGVDPARQRAGLGSWLLVQIEDVARDARPVALYRRDDGASRAALSPTRVRDRPPRPA